MSLFELTGWVVPGALFSLGAILGSFFNVVILRHEALGAKMNLLSGRSHCPHCQQKLAWLELIPLFSFIFLKGRCRKCHKDISLQYPLVELSMGLLVLSWGIPVPTALPQILELVLLTIIGGLMLVLFVIDLKTMLLPDDLVILLSGVTFLFLLVSGLSSPLGWPTLLLDVVWGISLGAGSLGLLWLGTKGKGLGFGDVKLMIPLGALLGAWGTATLLFIAFLAGGLLGAVLLATKLAQPRTAIPFGPFLIGAALLILLYPEVSHSFAALYLGI